MHIALLSAFLSTASPYQVAPEVRPETAPHAERGERLEATAFGPGVIETMQSMSKRAAARRSDSEVVSRTRNGRAGVWAIPSRNAAVGAHSGVRYVTNRWGDRRMGIGFGGPVDLAGFWVAGQASPGAWAPAIQVVGYIEGREIGRTDWFDDVGASPVWFEVDLAGVDRVEVLAEHAVQGAGWYALDDLSFTRRPESGEPEQVVLDFEDLPWRTVLTGNDYGGLTWETGTGDFTPPVRVIPAPHAPPGPPAADTETTPDTESVPDAENLLGGATLPVLSREFPGVRMFETGTAFIPPDTCGAVGIDHFVSIVNSKLTVFDKITGARLVDVPLVDFWISDGLGDPRVVFDPHSQRFFALASSGPSTARLYVAISLTSDPTGSWYKNFIEAAQGSDVGRWPDYPTLGVDAEGFYSAALMVGNGDPMTIWAIDKAPLLTATPQLTTVTAWRDRPFQGAIQPCVTYGNPQGEYLVSRRFDGSALRVRRIDGPLSAPTLFSLGPILTPTNLAANGAPAMGSVTNISTGDTRPMNAVYRDGSIWTAHTIRASGRAACRWYELDPGALSVAQIGTVADPVWHYFYPSITVNMLGDVAMGFSGSHAEEFVASFFTGRRATDAAGEMAPPEMLRRGFSSYEHLDGNGTNRWGDYSLTTVDPTDDQSFWTIQEYARQGNIWGTWVGRLQFEDCADLTSNTCVSSPTSTTAGAIMGSSGSTSLGANEFVLEASQLPGQKPGLFYYGATSIQAPFGDGFRCVGAGGGGTFRLYPIVQSDGSGFVQRAIDFSAPPTGSGVGQITPGSTWYFQLWFRDPQGPGGTGFNLTDGLEATFCR